jgi:hypothetical protein
MFHDFAKSPSAVLYFLFRHCDVPEVRLIPQDSHALHINFAYKLFSKSSIYLCFAKPSILTNSQKSLFRATLSISGHVVKLCAIRRQPSAALRVMSCLRALGPSCSAPVAHDGFKRGTGCMIQRNEADVPKMVTEQGKWLDGEAIFFEETCETRQ